MKKTLLIPCLLILAGCASDKASQDLYRDDEVGKAKRILPCTVISARPVMIRDSKSGEKGEVIGFIVGALATAEESDVPVVRYLGGLIGGAAGRAASDQLHELPGVEYTVLLASGEERQLVQNTLEGETLMQQGEACRLQVSGALNRVLPAAHYPAGVQRPAKTGFTE